MPQAPKVLRHRRTKRAPERRPNSHQRGYTDAWREFRIAWLKEQFGKGNIYCGQCGKLLDGASKDIHVDHIVDHKGDYERFWQESNLQALHKSCHSAKTARENGFGRNRK